MTRPPTFFSKEAERHCSPRDFEQAGLGVFVIIAQTKTLPWRDKAEAEPFGRGNRRWSGRSGLEGVMPLCFVKRIYCATESIAERRGWEGLERL